IVIEKQDGSFIMYNMDHYQWTEENCYWDNRLHEWVCETITHTEFYIYRRSSSDGITWGSPVKVQQTTLGVRNIAAIQKQDGTFLLVYMNKVGSAYYMRQKTSADGLSWGTASNVVLVDSGTGNPALLQSDSGVLYLAYRKGTSLYVTSNSGSGWSSPVQTTGVASGDPAFLQTETEIVLIYKGTDSYCYRISSSDGSSWSSPSQIAPNKIVSDPASVQRTDRSYRVTAQYISASALDLVKITEFSYTGSGYLSQCTDVLIHDSQTLKSSMHFEYDSKGRTTERISKDENGNQTEKTVFTYNSGDKVIRQDVYAGVSTEISYCNLTGYDNSGNVIYTRDPEGAEHYYSYANTSSQNQFTDSKGNSVQLFSNQFYTNSVPSHCQRLLVGEAFISSGKVTESYYKYDSIGNMIETKTLFPTRDYAVFSGTFDENGQTAFDIDLTGYNLTDAILVISSIAVPTQETFYETHSEVGKGWLDTGAWSGKYFMAEYYRCYSTNPPDCFDGSTKIGPFEHYPGTPNYTGYTTWVEENTQYVKTSYTKVVNEYPEKVEYNLNTSGWTTITDNLGSGTTSTTIPAALFVQGVNSLQFKESNTYSAKFDWTLCIDQGAASEEYVTTYTYDPYGNVTSMTDPRNNSKIYSYSSDYGYAYMTTAIDAIGNTFLISYNYSTGEITSITNRNGYTTSYQYDILGRVTRKINPDLSELEAVYDDVNNCVTIYDELDHFFMRFYDGLNRLTTVRSYSNGQLYASETCTYDYAGNIASRTDPGGNVYTYEYDSKGRNTEVINPDSTFTQTVFNDTEAKVTYIDENGHYTEYQYDWVGKLIAVKEYLDPPNFNLTLYGYDHTGNVTQIINANGEVTQMEYDSLFGPTVVEYPDGTTRSFTYDMVGNVLTKIDGNGMTSYTYDVNYRRVQIQYPDQSTEHFTYDPNGNCLSVTNDYSTVNYSYDNRDRLISSVHHIDGFDYIFTYNYDSSGNLTSVVYPDGTVVAKFYDDLGRLTLVEDYAEFGYSVDSLLQSSTYSNGVVTNFDYEQRHRPLSITAEKGGVNLLNLQYDYDETGNILELVSTLQDPVTHLQETTSEFFNYDALDQLTSASNGYGSVSFSYDVAGNRIQKLLNGNLEMYTYLSHDKLATAGEWSFTYDGNGNTLSKITDTDEWLYQYDGADRLTEVKRNSEIAGVYTYNGNGQRIKKIEWNPDSQQYETIVYLYSQGNIHFEKNLTTGLDALYIYGPTGKIAKKVGEETTYYHTDHLGSTRLVTDTTGSPITAVGYHPFGESEITGEKERYVFTGQETDSTGLYYYKARYYDPEIGRFLTQDTWGGNYKRPQTLNKYVYCMNNPLRYADPTGNVLTGDPEMDALLDSLKDGESDDQDDDESLQNKSNAFKLGYSLSAAVNCKLCLNLIEEHDIHNNSREAKQALALLLFPDEDQDEERKQFCEGWDAGESVGRYEAIDVVMKNVEKEIGEMQQCVEGLIDEVSEKIALDVGLGLLVPDEVAALQYITENFIGLATGEVPPSYEMEQFCQPEEEKGFCSGTIILVVLLGIGVMISLKQGGR
ncbi:MAG: RHS repeat-associated core domain-containing protein, partial [Candidatus Methanofastidiosia archaeon]